MADNKKYYYLKLKDNFYDDDRIKVIESMDNGVYYTNLLLKLYLKSLKTEGSLRFTKTIPYDAKMISVLTNVDIDTVRVGLKLLIDTGLIEELTDGTLYISEIQNFIGQSSTEADRKREYRDKIEKEKERLKLESEDKKLLGSGDNSDESFGTNVQTDVGQISGQDIGQMSGQSSDKNPPEYRDKSIYNNTTNTREEISSDNINMFDEPLNDSGENNDTLYQTILDYFLTKTGRMMALKDVVYVTQVLEFNTEFNFSDDIRIQLIKKVMDRLSENNSDIRGFKYYVSAIIDEFKLYSEIKNRAKIKAESKQGESTSNVIYSEDSPEMQLSQTLFNCMKKNNPDATEPDLQGWAFDFGIMLNIGKKKFDEVKKVIEWCQQDSFWKCNILKPSELHDKYDKLKLKMLSSNDHVSNKKQASQAQNYEQRKYDDEFFNQFYENLR